jgi:ribosomal protein L11 methyltransferase
MAWRELRVVVPAGLVDAASARLFAAGASGVQEDYLPGQAPPPRQPWDTGAPPPSPRQRVLVAWFEDPDEGAIAGALDGAVGAPTWTDVPDTDWETSWQQGFEPIVISPTLTISPPWCAPPGALLIEPGQGFGTGLHPSTQAALRLMEPLFADARSCLDLGCGSGVLALAAARAGLTARGVDVEASAVAEARRHAALNDLQATFDETPIPDLDGAWDLVAANLHAELIAAFAGPIVARVGRWLVVAGILADREQVARAALDPHLVLDARDVDGEWVALRYRRGPA